VRHRLAYFRDPNGIVHISIGFNGALSALHCEIDGRNTFKFEPENLVLTDDVPTCIECTRKAR